MTGTPTSAAPSTTSAGWGNLDSAPQDVSTSTVARKTDIVKGSITTINVTSHGCLFDYLPTATAQVLIVQEHHLVEEKLQQARGRARDMGWHGHWAPRFPAVSPTADLLEALRYWSALTS